MSAGLRNVCHQYVMSNDFASSVTPTNCGIMISRVGHQAVALGSAWLVSYLL